MEYTIAILSISTAIVAGLLFLAMAIGGLKTGKVYYVSTAPPIVFKVNPMRHVLWTAFLLGLSVTLLSGAVIASRTLIENM